MRIACKPTWRSRLGLMIIGIGAAWIQGDIVGGLAVLGTWMIWEDLK